MDYDMSDYVESSLVRMEILVNAEPVDAFSTIVHSDKGNRGRAPRQAQGHLPRQLFKIALCLELLPGNTSATERTTAKCYGGDISKKKIA